MALRMQHSVGKAFSAPSTRPSTRLVARAAPARDSERSMVPPFAGAAIAIATFFTSAQLSYAGIPDKTKLPPIPSDPTRCEKLSAALIGETTGKKLNKPQVRAGAAACLLSTAECYWEARLQFKGPCRLARQQPPLWTCANARSMRQICAPRPWQEPCW
eukprot:1136619-Pelagomonas_calceolata.AAC.3